MFGRRITVLLRFPGPARLPASTPFQQQHHLPVRTLLFQSRRSYATPGRPRKAVGEPSRPVKRAVKRSVATATSSDSPAKKKNEAKKENAAKKPAVKKVAPRKTLTEEQKAAKKAAAQARSERAKKAELKKVALDPPADGARISAWNVFFAEKNKGNKPLSNGDSGQSKHEAYVGRLTENVRALASQWKQITPEELEHYNHLAHTTKEAAQAEYKRWVESHTPEQIRTANIARQSLKRKAKAAGNKKFTYAWPAIRDERAAKRPLNAFTQFSLNRHASGDLKNISLGDSAKLIGKEWRALSESEKNKYKALHIEDSKRFVDEYSNVYGHAPPSYDSPRQAQAAAAAA